MYLIVYDISDDRTRTKVAQLLLKEGYERLQYSVFVGTGNPKQTSCWKSIEQLFINKETGEPIDRSVLSIHITTENFRSMDIIGDFYDDIDYLSGEANSLIF